MTARISHGREGEPAREKCSSFRIKETEAASPAPQQKGRMQTLYMCARIGQTLASSANHST